MGVIVKNQTEVQCLHCNRLVEKPCFFILEIDACKKKVVKDLQDEILKDKQDDKLG
jgi:hypothetical protein